MSGKLREQWASVRRCDATAQTKGSWLVQLNSHILGKKAVRFLLYLLHVVAIPVLGGKQHVFPAQYQDGETSLTELRNHSQQLKGDIQKHTMTHMSWLTALMYQLHII